MKLFIVFLSAAFLQVSSQPFSPVTISETDASLKKIFRQIEQQTGYVFWYNISLIDTSAVIDITVKETGLDKTLDLCLKNVSLTYTIVDKVIVLRRLQASEKIPIVSTAP